MADKTERRANAAMKFAFRVFINVAVVLFLASYFSQFFILRGGMQAIAIVALTFTVLNWLVVPLLHVLSFPIKLIAWIIAFLFVNAAAIWITVWFVGALGIAGVSLAIGEGLVGWPVSSVCLGIGNWLVRAVVK